jgi:hypothetical protein
MKFFNIGENSNFGPIEIKEAKSQNKFGTMYYMEKIQFSTTVPITDYNVWKSTEGQNYLCVRYEPLIREELIRLIEAINAPSNMKFKEISDSELYFKMVPQVANSIPLNQKINITIQVFGIFQQKANDTSYLQMEVVSASV